MLSFVPIEMMSQHRNLAVLLLLLSTSFLLHSHVFTHAASTSPPVTRQRIIYLTAMGSDDDYDDDDHDIDSSPPEVVSSVKTPLLHQQPLPCQYDPCLENQEPCASQAGCLCPGISSGDKPPRPPTIQKLLPISDGDDRGKVEVWWCAPSSVVSGYRVLVEGHNSDVIEVGHGLRRGVVKSLEAGTKVCVEALNEAGHSSPSEFSCQRFDPSESTDHSLLFWVIGGGVSLLFLLIIASVVLWKCKMCRRAKRDTNDGLGNPSYSTEGTLWSRSLQTIGPGQTPIETERTATWCQIVLGWCGDCLVVYTSVNAWKEEQQCSWINTNQLLNMLFWG